MSGRAGDGVRSDLLSVNEGRRSHEASRKQVGSGERSPRRILILVKRASTSASLCLFTPEPLSHHPLPPQHQGRSTQSTQSINSIQVHQLFPIHSSISDPISGHCFRFASQLSSQAPSVRLFTVLAFRSRSTRSSAPFVGPIVPLQTPSLVVHASPCLARITARLGRSLLYLVSSRIRPHRTIVTSA